MQGFIILAIIGTEKLIVTEVDGGNDGRTLLQLDTSLGTYKVRKSSQESVSTQQIPGKFYGINLIFSKLALFICK